MEREGEGNEGKGGRLMVGMGQTWDRSIIEFNNELFFVIIAKQFRNSNNFTPSA